MININRVSHTNERTNIVNREYLEPGEHKPNCTVRCNVYFSVGCDVHVWRTATDQAVGLADDSIHHICVIGHDYTHPPLSEANLLLPLERKQGNLKLRSAQIRH